MTEDTAVLVDWTAADRLNAQTFSNYNNTVRIFNAMYKKRPNIMSKLSISVRKATQDDFYLPRKLDGKAMIIKVSMTEASCRTLSCNPVQQDKPCLPTTAAAYYHVGDDSYDVHCQPACFNTLIHVMYDETGKSRVPETPLLSWHDNSCRIVNTQIQSWEEHPFYRSQTIYERGVNDMPIGFSRKPSNDKYGVGYTYHNNAAYCGYYELEYNASKDTCEEDLLTKIFGVLVGSKLLQNLKGAIKLAINYPDTGMKPLPSKLTALPTTKLPTPDEWLNDVDKTFVLPKIIDYTQSIKLTDPPITRRRKRDATIDDIGDDDDAVINEPPSEKTKQNNLRQHLEATYRPMIEKKYKRDTVVQQNTTEAEDDDELKQSNFKKAWEIIVALVSDDQVWLSVGLDITSTVLLNKLKSFTLKLAETMATKLATNLTRISGTFGIRVIQTAIQNCVLKVISGAALRIGAQLTIFLAKMLAAAASVVGWILMVSFVLDLMFTFWDPLGYNKIFDAAMPADMMYNGQLALRDMVNGPTANFEYENLIGMILTEEEITLLTLESLVDQLVYLDALTVNSEGSVIDKGNVVDLSVSSKQTSEQFQKAASQALSLQYQFTEEKFNTFNRDFYERSRVNNITHKIGLFGTVIGCAILILIKQFTIIAFLVILLSLFLLCFGSIFTIQHNELIEFVHNTPYLLQFLKNSTTQLKDGQ